MSKIYNNGIVTTAGFQFNANTPLDDRLAVESFEDLAALTSYEGMIVYVQNEACHYKKANDEWSILVSIPEVDQTFNADSENAQSGRAVARALAENSIDTLKKTYDVVTFYPNGDSTTPNKTSEEKANNTPITELRSVIDLDAEIEKQLILNRIEKSSSSWNSKLYYFPKGCYHISKPIILSGRYIRVKCEGTIIYHGPDAAVRMHGDYGSVYIHDIECTNPNSIGFDVTPFFSTDTVDDSNISKIIHTTGQKPAHNDIKIDYVGASMESGNFVPGIGVRLHVPNYPRTNTEHGNGSITYNSFELGRIAGHFIALDLSCECKPSYINSNRFDIRQLAKAAVPLNIETEMYDNNELFSDGEVTSADNGTNYCHFSYLNIELAKGRPKLKSQSTSNIKSAMLSLLGSSTSGTISASTTKIDFNSISETLHKVLLKDGYVLKFDNLNGDGATIYISKSSIGTYKDTWLTSNLKNARVFSSQKEAKALFENALPKKVGGKFYDYRETIDEHIVAVKNASRTFQERLDALRNLDIIYVDGNGKSYIDDVSADYIGILNKSKLESLVRFLYLDNYDGPELDLASDLDDSIKPVLQNNFKGYEDKLTSIGEIVENISTVVWQLQENARKGTGIFFRDTDYNNIEYLKFILGESTDMTYTYSFSGDLRYNKISTVSADLDTVHVNTNYIGETIGNVIDSPWLRYAENRIKSPAMFADGYFKYKTVQYEPCFIQSLDSLYKVGYRILDKDKSYVSYTKLYDADGNLDNISGEFVKIDGNLEKSYQVYRIDLNVFKGRTVYNMAFDDTVQDTYVQFMGSYKESDCEVSLHLSDGRPKGIIDNYGAMIVDVEKDIPLDVSEVTLKYKHDTCYVANTLKLYEINEFSNDATGYLIPTKIRPAQALTKDKYYTLYIPGQGFINADTYYTTLCSQLEQNITPVTDEVTGEITSYSVSLPQSIKSISTKVANAYFTFDRAKAVVFKYTQKETEKINTDGRSAASYTADRQYLCLCEYENGRGTPADEVPTSKDQRTTKTEARLKIQESARNAEEPTKIPHKYFFYRLAFLCDTPGNDNDRVYFEANKQIFYMNLNGTSTQIKVNSEFTNSAKFSIAKHSLNYKSEWVVNIIPNITRQEMYNYVQAQLEVVQGHLEIDGWLRIADNRQNPGYVEFSKVLTLTAGGGGETFELPGYEKLDLTKFNSILVTTNKPMRIGAFFADDSHFTVVFNEQDISQYSGEDIYANITIKGYLKY